MQMKCEKKFWNFNTVDITQFKTKNLIKIPCKVVTRYLMDDGTISGVRQAYSLNAVRISKYVHAVSSFDLLMNMITLLVILELRIHKFKLLVGRDSHQNILVAVENGIMSCCSLFIFITWYVGTCRKYNSIRIWMIR